MGHSMRHRLAIVALKKRLGQSYVPPMHGDHGSAAGLMPGARIVDGRKVLKHLVDGLLEVP